MATEYSVFAKMDGKYKRIGSSQFTLNLARRVYQDVLLAGSMNGFAMYLKPIHDYKPEYDEAAWKAFLATVKGTKI